MSTITLTRRQLLNQGIRWCGMAAMTGLASACGGRFAAGDRQLVREAQNLSVKEIARRKLHHGETLNYG
ncbi:MAG: hypothetical protein QNJ58_08195 [Desulfobacterales bacterium]|nr:hypothetical protein [Desulfobacterales bacterium]